VEKIEKNLQFEILYLKMNWKKRKLKRMKNSKNVLNKSYIHTWTH